MPPPRPPSNTRRRILRIISFGKYANKSDEDINRTSTTTSSHHSHNATTNYELAAQNNDAEEEFVRTTSEDRQVSNAQLDSSEFDRTVIRHEDGRENAGFSVAAFRDQHRDYYNPAYSFSDTTEPASGPDTEQSHRYASSERGRNSASELETTDPEVYCGNCKTMHHVRKLHCPRCGARMLHWIQADPSSLEPQNEASAYEPRPSSNFQRNESTQREDSWTTTMATTSISNSENQNSNGGRTCCCDCQGRCHHGIYAQRRTPLGRYRTLDPRSNEYRGCRHAGHWMRLSEEQSDDEGFASPEGRSGRPWYLRCLCCCG